MNFPVRLSVRGTAPVLFCVLESGIEQSTRECPKSRQKCREVLTRATEKAQVILT